jgi:chromatin remodeling complex protein RSC6
MIDVTNHGRRRIKERCGIKAKGTGRLAKIAFSKGLSRSDVSGSLYKYIDYLYHYNEQANNIRLYGDKVYIFCNEVLVTVLDTPKKYRSIVNRLMKERNNGTAE